MILNSVFARLHSEGLISDGALERVQAYNRVFPLRVELKIVLYAGVLLLSSGLSLLVYQHIDTIGHQVILAFIALLSTACFFYCGRKKLPFARAKVESPGDLFDYILLLGCLTFLIFVAYLQYQYDVFGSRYGLATFFPMLLLFFVAYYFDHLGVLSMAITSFAAWLGLTVTPLQILQSNDFSSGRLIFTAAGLGIILLLAGDYSKREQVKPHFEFTYVNFGTHILYIALLAGLFHFDGTFLLWFAGLCLFCIYSYLSAKRQHSFYFILVTMVYGYVGLSYVVLRIFYLLDWDWGGMYLSLIYLILSGLWLVRFLMKTSKTFRTA